MSVTDNTITVDSIDFAAKCLNFCFPPKSQNQDYCCKLGLDF